jgi:hypothetical protein
MQRIGKEHERIDGNASSNDLRSNTPTHGTPSDDDLLAFLPGKLDDRAPCRLQDGRPVWDSSAPLDVGELKTE